VGCGGSVAAIATAATAAATPAAHRQGVGSGVAAAAKAAAATTAAAPAAAGAEACREGRKTQRVERGVCQQEQTSATRANKLPSFVMLQRKGASVRQNRSWYL
jgi:hypothetical protein